MAHSYALDTNGLKRHFAVKTWWQNVYLIARSFSSGGAEHYAVYGHSPQPLAGSDHELYLYSYPAVLRKTKLLQHSSEI